MTVESPEVAAVAVLTSAWTSRPRFGRPETLLAITAVALWVGVIPAEVVLTFLA